MARRTSHPLASLERASVDVADHLHHLAGGLFGFLLVLVEAPLRTDDVTVIATHAERGGNELHRRPELLGRKIFQYLDVLEVFDGGLARARRTRRLRSLWTGSRLLIWRWCARWSWSRCGLLRSNADPDEKRCSGGYPHHARHGSCYHTPSFDNCDLFNTGSVTEVEVGRATILLNAKQRRGARGSDASFTTGALIER